MIELRHHFKGAAIIGCSTSGEIVGDTVVDDSVIATAVEFEHTRLRTASATMTERSRATRSVRSSARQLNDTRCATWSCSDGLNVIGSDLSRGLASEVADGVSITGGLSGDGTDFAETWASPTMPPALKRWPRSACGDDLRVGYASMGGWGPFGPLRTITRARATCSMSSMGQPPRPLQDVSGRPRQPVAGLCLAVPRSSSQKRRVARCRPDRPVRGRAAGVYDIRGRHPPGGTRSS